MTEAGLANSEGFGFFCVVADQKHFDRLESKTSAKGYFTDRVTSDRVSVRLSDIALVVSPSEILTWVSHVRPTRAATTGTKGFKATGPVRVDLKFDDLQQVVGAAHLEEIRRGFTEPCFRPSRHVWEVVWAAILRLRPDLRAQLDQIWRLRFDESFEFTEDSLDEELFLEKDAVGVALDIAGIGYSGVFANLSESRRDGKSLVQSLCGNVTEDVVINHDVHVFPYFLVDRNGLDSCEFRQGSRRLLVVNVNRRRGERSLGVDLIYHNVHYNAFTFVQYKMLNQEGSQQLPAWRYRLDGQFDKEADRMRQARARLGIIPATDPDGYRMGSDAFFIKLCKRQRLKVNAGQLANGFYVDLTHCDLHLRAMPSGHARVLEPRATLTRWLNRTQFTDLVAYGWIGTNNVTQSELIDYIENALSGGRSVVIAQGERGVDSADDQEPDWEDDDR